MTGKGSSSEYPATGKGRQLAITPPVNAIGAVDSRLSLQVDAKRCGRVGFSRGCFFGILRD